MGKILKFVLIIVIASCKNEGQNLSTSNIDGRKYLDISKVNLEVLEYKEGFINGNLSLKTNIQDVEKVFKNVKKQECSINTSNNVISNYLYYDFMKFQAIESELFLEEINFINSDIFIKFPTIVLSQKTLIGDVMTIFPESSKLLKGGGNQFHGALIVRASKEVQHYGVWFLYFESGHLVKLIYIE